MALTKISTGGVKDDAASQAKIADEAIDEARLQVSNAGTNGQFLQKQSGNTGGLTWATVTVPDSDKIEEGNTSVETVDTGSDGHVKITTEGTERVRIDENGLIGVNMTPQTSAGSTYMLQMSSGGTQCFMSLGNNTSGVGPNNGVVIGNDASNAYLWNREATPMQLGTSDLVRFQIGSSGQLGVGGATYGSSGQVLTSQGASAAPQWADATSAAMGYDLWCVTADFGYYREWNREHALGSAQTFTNDGGSGDASGGPGPATMSISRCTTSQNPLFVKVGTGMSMSNGIWTFPNTGEWRVTFAPQMISGNTGGEATQNMFIYTTSNNGTDWHMTYKRRGRNGRYTWRSINAGPLIARFKITDTSNQKVKFGVGDGDVRLRMEGATDLVESHFVFEQIS